MFGWEIRIPVIQTNVFVAMSNSVWIGDNINLTGVSLNGDIVAKANDKEQIIYADIEVIEVYKCRNENNI